jgi:hypothetical protein
MRKLLRLKLLSFSAVLLLGTAAALTVASRDRVVSARLQLAPDVLDFGRIELGASEQVALIATNFGERPLVVRALAVGEPFRLLGGTRSLEAPLSLEPGESRAIPIVFRATARGPVQASLDVASDGGDFSVPLRAVGYRPPEIRVTPPSLSFGEVEVGRVGRALLKIRNEGDAELRLRDVRGGFPFAAESSAASVPPGAELAVPIAFAPDRVGRHETSLSIYSNDPTRERVLVHLRGAGSQVAPEPAIETSATTLDFGAVPACEARRRSIAVSNRGEDVLSIASVTTSPPFSGPSRSFRLQPGQSFRLELTFSPEQAGPVLDELVIHSNDPRMGVASVRLTGEGEGARACDSGGAEAVAVDDPGDRAGAAFAFGSAGATPKAVDEAVSEARSPAAAEAAETPGPPDAAPPPPVREGSAVRLGSYSRDITPAHVESVTLDEATGLLALGGVQLPVVEFPFGEYFEFAPTGGIGRVTELGDVDVLIPLEIVDRYGTATHIELPLTTQTAETWAHGTHSSRAGDPLGGSGDATLVGLATFPSGRLRGFTMEIVLNVHVEH